MGMTKREFMLWEDKMIKDEYELDDLLCYQQADELDKEEEKEQIEF